MFVLVGVLLFRDYSFLRFCPLLSVEVHLQHLDSRTELLYRLPLRFAQTTFANIMTTRLKRTRNHDTGSIGHASYRLNREKVSDQKMLYKKSCSSRSREKLMAVEMSIYHAPKFYLIRCACDSTKATSSWFGESCQVAGMATEVA